jgi:Rha family phage regulatory protein
MKNTDITNFIHLDGERIFVTSLEISNHFEKRHDDVLKAIRNLECSDEFRLRNFAETVHNRQNPSGGKQIGSPMYQITRNGFSFLVGGFTGKQAALWKERYINEFERMEKYLREQTIALPAVLTLDDLNALLDRPIQISVREYLGLTRGKVAPSAGHGHGEHYSDALRAEVLELGEKGWLPSEIAERTGVPKATVSTMLFRARKAGKIAPGRGVAGKGTDILQ